MPGFSVTLLLLPTASSSSPTTSHLLSLLDEPADVPGWKWSSRVAPPSQPIATPPRTSQSISAKTTSGLKVEDSKEFAEGIKRACNALVKAEPQITEMDVIAGDGDCGLTLKVCIPITWGFYLTFDAWNFDTGRLVPKVQLDLSPE
jgi:triose/dihydroxyacetone kinase / FAD-AMP lyase (cyclizing)